MELSEKEGFLAFTRARLRSVKIAGGLCIARTGIT